MAMTSLIVEMPDLFGQADRLKEVNVRTGKPLPDAGH